jgi:hypothetical protein
MFQFSSFVIRQLWFKHHLFKLCVWLTGLFLLLTDLIAGIN